MRRKGGRVEERRWEKRREMNDRKGGKKKVWEGRREGWKEGEESKEGRNERQTPIHTNL